MTNVHVYNLHAATSHQTPLVQLWRSLNGVIIDVIISK